jgi:hypothetical protein
VPVAGRDAPFIDELSTMTSRPYDVRSISIHTGAAIALKPDIDVVRPVVRDRAIDLEAEPPIVVA